MQKLSNENIIGNDYGVGLNEHELRCTKLNRKLSASCVTHAVLSQENETIYNTFHMFVCITVDIYRF